MKTKLLEQLESVLKTIPHYWNDEELLRTRVVEDLNSNNEELIEALLTNDYIKEKYTQIVGGVTLFNKDELKHLLAYKGYWHDSYTKYSNSIGLTSDGKFLEYNSDVVLDFPFKDCVLEGGMTQEDVGKEEVYFNEVIARDEIDTLLAPKVFTNSKRYSEGGVEESIAEIKESDNLIIKGNNLLALHSLKERYAGKVKLIYIDPPYNTGNDSFKYNDRFNHSTWLTFMKNRLEIARDLLRDDGVILVQCDDFEQAYLKVLMDNIFGGKNFIDTFIWKNTDNAPTLAVKTRKDIEFIHCYEKRRNNLSYRGRESANDDAPLLNRGNPLQELEFPSEIIKFNIEDGVYKKGEYGRVELLDDLIVDKGVNQNKIRLKGEFKWRQDNLNREISEGTYFLIKSDRMSIRYQRMEASNIAPEKFIDTDYLSKAMGIATNEDSKKEIDKLNLDFPSYPKPESLIAFFIRAVTNKKDLVLDFFMGSGTTAAVSHKMNRQYIGIEQLDYIKEVSAARLQKVIEGEQGGISKEVEWKGGGSFVYTELKELNQTYIKMIQGAQDEDELLSIFATLKDKSSFGYSNAYFDFKADVEKLAKDFYEVDGLPRKQAFQELELHDQKRLLIETLDKNQLYVNYAEMNDASYQVSEADKAFTHSFYGKDEA